MGSPLRRSIFSIFGSLVTTLIELALRKSVDQGRIATDSVPFVRECLQNNPHTDIFNPTSRIPSAAHCKTGRAFVIGWGSGAIVTTGSGGPTAMFSRP